MRPGSLSIPQWLSRLLRPRNDTIKLNSKSKLLLMFVNVRVTFVQNIPSGIWFRDFNESMRLLAEVKHNLVLVLLIGFFHKYMFLILVRNFV